MRVQRPHAFSADLIDEVGRGSFIPLFITMRIFVRDAILNSEFGLCKIVKLPGGDKQAGLYPQCKRQGLGAYVRPC